jgi:CHAD domain-containing protein
MIKRAVGLPSTTGELALNVLRLQATLFAEHVPQARLGADPEHVHDSRVATRRMRGAVRLFKDVLPEGEVLDTELRWIASQLGPVRDLDVQLKRQQALAIELDLAEPLAPYIGWLQDQREEAQFAFDTAFQSDRFVALTVRLREVNELGSLLDHDAPVEDDAPKRMRRAYRRLRKHADGLHVDSPAEAFHRVRIGAKRLRYAAEFFEPLYGKAAKRLIAAATEVQDVLGDHQDGIVNRQHIEEAVRCAEWPRETMLAVGQVIQWEAHHAEDLRRQFPQMYAQVKKAYRQLQRHF